MKILFLFLACLLLLGSVGAETFSGQINEPILLTTTCLYNGVLSGENASVRIVNSAGDVILNDSLMTMYNPGVFKYNWTAPVIGQYTAVQTCYYAGGATSNGTDDIEVSSSWWEFVLLGLTALLVIVGYKKPNFMVLGGLTLILWTILFNRNILITVFMLLFGLVLIYTGWKRRS